MQDDCNENDCGCYSESIDSIWFDKNKAEKVAETRYHAHVDEHEVDAMNDWLFTKGNLKGPNFHPPY